MLDELRKIISEKLNIDENSIGSDTSLTDDLHADSLDKVEIIMQVEENFGITIDDDAALNFRTIGDVVKYIEANK
ncbi:MAG TPA: acyl carrier protein [Candidatus Ornithoclostridium excrementipullorum]|nr:acyl carrier protein [Candidatus Ornithoclostridium excrementipullorum]